MPARPVEELPVPPGLSAGAPVPWWVKLGAKLVIGALPVPPRAWRALGLRRHSFGADDAARQAQPVIDTVAHATRLIGRAPRGFLELGPGAMVRRAPVAAALGLGPIWYLDVEDDAPNDLAPYRMAADAARAAGLAPPDLAGCATRADVLKACGATLLIGGTERLSALAAGTIDLVVSEAVLEHVRREDLAPLLAELRRVTARDGIGLHGVDFKDHMGGALRHLAFAPAFWEGRAVARAALYTNRLGLTEMLEAFAAAGFAAESPHRLVWDAPPLPPGGVHPALRRRSEDNRVAHAAIEARPT
ncbi:methyltransferase domain-containing protein [Falsiroseomonas oryzae]|uniref:methyltransferase domain-containing protein n=1 Tax=Falsiroseomonas oryzae TaxID=2766473 RepID=UPI0022EB5C85|nr:methyltransferase domain-containing protein [Roseomonas sp. MO-31]